MILTLMRVLYGRQSEWLCGSWLKCMLLKMCLMRTKYKNMVQKYEVLFRNKHMLLFGGQVLDSGGNGYMNRHFCADSYYNSFRVPLKTDEKWFMTLQSVLCLTHLSYCWPRADSLSFNKENGIWATVDNSTALSPLFCDPSVGVFRKNPTDESSILQLSFLR